MEELLFLVHRIPYPPIKGDKIRSWHFLSRFLKQYKVHLGCFVDDKADIQYIDQLADMCASSCMLPLNPLWSKVKSLKALAYGKSLTELYYKNRDMQNWVNALSSNRTNLQRAFVFSSPMAQYLEGENWPSKRKVMDFVDLDSDKWRQYAAKKNLVEKYIYSREANLLGKFENKIAENFDHSFFVTDHEKDLFLEQGYKGQKDKIYTVPNGIDHPFWDLKNKGKSPYPSTVFPIVFCGAMDYWPNIDAAIWFSNEIMPEILKEIPEAVFYIVGSNPTQEVQDLSDLNNIIVTGRVDDIRPYVMHAKLVVAPMRVSRGIQNKVIEGMVAGKAVLATSRVLKPMGIDKGDMIIPADTAQDYIEKIKELHDAPLKADQIGQKARDYILKYYDWDVSFAKIASLLG
jgi:sugar transferase (PEP-CTERM/EpsH1 system associated)